MNQPDAGALNASSDRLTGAVPAAAVENAPADAGSHAAPAWPLWQRLALRFLACYYLLYTLPRPCSNLLVTLARGLQAVADTTQAPWSWLGSAAAGMGKVEQGWEWLTGVLQERGLTPVEVIHQPTGSGDTAHDYVKLACIVALALLCTAVWSLVALRSRGHPTLGRWLHLCARWDLAFWMLSYGSIKFYTGQFGEPGLMQLTRELGDKSPMGMVWTFMGASKPYEIFAGAGEVLGAVLLFHRRTALLGCFVTIAVMTNVVALNWLYDVPVKLFSLNLLLCAVFLLAPYRERLWGLLVSNRPTAPVDLAVTKHERLAWILVGFGWLWAVGTLVQAHFSGMAQLERRATQRARPELYGLWNVETMLLDGAEVPATDATRWKSFAIDQGGSAWVREMTGQVQWFEYKEDIAGGTVVLKPRPNGDERTCSFERGKKTVKVLNPEPRTMAEYNKMVDVERRTLVVRGPWGGKQLELHTVEKVFTLHRGFHWVQEMPVNR